MFRWNKAKPKKKKTAHVRKEPPKPYTPPDIPKFTKQSEKAKPKEEKRVSPEKIVNEVIAETGATNMKDMGTVMKAAKEKIGAAADGKTISDAVKKLLSK